MSCAVFLSVCTIVCFSVLRAWLIGWMFGCDTGARRMCFRPSIACGFLGGVGRLSDVCVVVLAEDRVYAEPAMNS